MWVVQTRNPALEKDLRVWNPYCVRGKSDTVDFVDFPQSRPCWIQRCRQCVPGLILPVLNICAIFRRAHPPPRWRWIGLRVAYINFTIFSEIGVSVSKMSRMKNSPWNLCERMPTPVSQISSPMWTPPLENLLLVLCVPCWLTRDPWAIATFLVSYWALYHISIKRNIRAQSYGMNYLVT